MSKIFANLKIKISQLKKKYIDLSKEVKLLSTKTYIFVLVRSYFTNNDGIQNMFVYQPALRTLQQQKHKGAGYVIS